MIAVRRNSMLRAAALVLLLYSAGLHLAIAAEPQRPAGWSSSALYNLANQYARQGNTGSAVLNYERARLLSPRDSDVAANLKFVRESRRIAAPHAGWLDPVTRMAAPNTFYWLGVTGLLIAAGAVLLRQLYPRLRPAIVRAIICVSLVGPILLVYDAAAIYPRLDEAVVIAAVSPVRASPAPAAEPLFDLKAAEIVTIDAQRAGYQLIHTSTGQTGWAPRFDLARIIPRA